MPDTYTTIFTVNGQGNFFLEAEDLGIENEKRTFRFQVKNSLGVPVKSKIEFDLSNIFEQISITEQVFEDGQWVDVGDEEIFEEGIGQMSINVPDENSTVLHKLILIEPTIAYGGFALEGTLSYKNVPKNKKAVKLQNPKDLKD